MAMRLLLRNNGALESKEAQTYEETHQQGGWSQKGPSENN